MANPPLRKPDPQVLLHRLASLAEGMWMSHEVERELREAGADPAAVIEGCREFLAQIAEGKPRQ